MSLSIHRLFKRTAVAVCLSSLILTAQSPQSAPGASTGAAGEIVGLPPQSTEVTDGGFAPDTGPGPRQVDPFYRVTPGHMQLDTGTTTSLAPTLSRSFQGITDTGWFPPDPIIAAGPSHLVACTNAHVAIYDKANGNRLSLTTALTFFGSLSTGFRLFDPWVVYDRHSSRFFLMFTSTNSGGSNAGRYYIAVSKSSNPTSGWWLYWNDATVNGSTATSNWGDYPRLAVDQNAIYITANMFQFGGSFQYSKVRIMQSKATMLSGGSSQTWWDFWSIKLTGSSTNAFTVQPCHDYDTKTSTAAAYFMACVNGTGSNLYIYGITNVLNRTTGPSFYSTSVGVASYASPGNSTQQGGTTQLENVAPRLMNAVKRNGSMWTCHSTSISGGAAATWYEVPVNSWPTSGSCSLRQQQAFHAGAGYWYAFPSVAVNQNNDMTMVFNRSGTTEYCGCRVTRRLGNAPLNTLEGSTLVKAGEAYYVRLQNGTRNR
ncbi:MAG: hypothetical protein KDC87_01900, partial [Planctomycetes bacterium]|nr:hypothetical protein [Planctomycetota bacterium]